MANSFTPDDPTVRDLDSHFENNIVDTINTDADLHVARHDDDYPMAFYEGYVSVMDDIHIVDVTDERITFAWDKMDDETPFDEFVADEIRPIHDSGLVDPSQTRFEAEADTVIEKKGYSSRVSGQCRQRAIDEHDEIGMTFIDVDYDHDAAMSLTLHIGLEDQRDE